MALSKQDQAFMDAKRAQGASFDEAWAALQKVKGGGQAPTQAKGFMGMAGDFAKSQFEKARNEPLAGPIIGATKKAIKTGGGLAAQAFEAAPGILGQGVKPFTENIASSIREDISGIQNETIPEKIGGTGLDIAAILGTSGAAGAALKGVESAPLVAKAAQYAPKITQFATQTLPRVAAETTAFTQTSEQRAPKPLELALGALGEGAVVLGGKFASKVPDMAKKILQGPLTDNANRVYQKIVTAGQESPLYKKYSEYLTAQSAHNTDKLAQPSAIRVFGNKISDGLKSVKEKLRIEVGPKIGQLLDGSVDAASVGQIKSTFEDSLSSLGVKPIVKGNVSKLTPKSFVGSVIELTPDDQAALIKTYDAIQKRKGTIPKKELDNLGTSIEGLINYTKGSSVQSLTQAEKPLSDIAKKIDELVKSGLTEEDKAAYAMYSKGKRAERLLSKRLGDFGQGEFATGKSALGEQKFGLEVRQGLEDIKELTGVDLMEDLDVLSLVAEQVGDAQMKSLLNIVAMPRMGVSEAIATGIKGAYNYALPHSQLMRAVLEAPELEDVPVGVIKRLLQAIGNAGGAEAADQVTQ